MRQVIEMTDSPIAPYLALIRRRCPDFAFHQARLLTSSGQFNTALCLDERWIFRFPKSRHAAAEVAQELEILPRARFYQRHYALIQALYALRDNDPDEFEDGIAAYR